MFLFIGILCIAWACFVTLAWWLAREHRIRRRRRQRAIEVIDLSAARVRLGRRRR
jgi:hypothetical protein